MHKVRKDARCHGICGLLRSECWCGWKPPSKDRTQMLTNSNAGRPRHERKYTEHEIWMRDDDAPAWFREAMMWNVKMLSTQEFAKRFGTNVIQVRRWIDLGLVHCAWTWPVYAEEGKWVDDGITRVKKKKTHVKLMRYTLKRWIPGEEKRPSHRRIPVTELERCQCLKSRQRSAYIDPKDLSIAESEPQSVSIPKKQSESEGQRKPLHVSEPVLVRKPEDGSEPDLGSKPDKTGEPIDIRKPLDVSEPHF